MGTGLAQQGHAGSDTSTLLYWHLALCVYDARTLDQVQRIFEAVSHSKILYKSTG